MYLIMTSLNKNNVDNINYFEILATEFIKNLEKMTFKKFSSCYFLLAMSGISSKPLIFMC